MAESSKKRPWRRDRPVSNPYRDTLSQEIGYKVDGRTAGCLLTAFAVGVLMLFGSAFVVYWFMH
jgi:hypothetical protein